MFFLASKVLWFVLVPVHLLLFGAFVGACAARGRFASLGRGLAIFCGSALLLIAFSPISVGLIRPLEDRFASPSAEMAAPTGIIVLGGAIDDEIGQARHQVSFGEGAGRLTEAAVLARRYPEARIVYTGGSSSILGRPSAESAEAKKLLVALGVDPNRIQLEERSRNTDENARFTRDLIAPKSGEVWLLVTSAYHMPRSIGLFRKAGFTVVAYPVDFHSNGDSGDWRFVSEATSRLRLFDIAIHEWVGLIAYRLAGKIDDWFPGP
jgi:uncharacterized SAM-binding protein YcdF (DUF218 family)